MALPQAQQQGWGFPSDFRHKQMVGHTGHEVPNKVGATFAWEKYRYNLALTDINQQSQLGMDAKDLEILTMMYNALSQVRRFGADKRLDAYKGENPATHSLHSVIELDHVLARSGQSPEVCADIRATAGKALLIHDCGEILGEFNTLAQRANAPDLQEDPDAERRILAHSLRLAIEAVEHKNPDSFYTKIDDLKARAGIFKDGKPQGITKSASDLDKLFDRTPSISAEGEQRVQKWLALWDVCEMKEDNLVKFTDNDAFVGWLAKSVEHVQGTRHLLRVAERDSTHLKKTTSTLGMTDTKMTISTLKYLEGELGSLFANAQSDVEQDIAREQGTRTYQTAREFLGLVPPLVDKIPEPRKIPQAADEGTVAERLARESDRGEARRAIAKIARDSGEKVGDFKGRMNTASLTMYKDAQARLLGLYELAERAVNEGSFTPSVDSKTGKGQVLALDPPPEFQLPITPVAAFAR